MDSAAHLKVLTYNIHKGFSTLKRHFVLDAIKEAIQSTGSQMVFLQEVIGENDRHSRRLDDWPLVPQLEYLADTVWPHFAYGKNSVYTDGHHGNAILSSFPFTSYENIDISNSRREQRGLLHATTTPLGEDRPELHLICVHLDIFQKGRRPQYERIIQRIEEHVPHDAPLIIAGDFNDWRQDASDILEDALGMVEAHRCLHGRHARSFPSHFPILRLDRIYVRGMKPVEARCFARKPWNQLSDHGALLATLQFDPELPVPA